MPPVTSDITSLLMRYRQGEREALEKLVPLVQDQLKQIARGCLNRFGAQNTLVPTALVNEAFMRLIQKQELTLNDRTHFYAVAAQCMRWVLIDYAKARKREKRGGGGIRVSFDEHLHSEKEEMLDLEALEVALVKLGEQDPRLARVVELRFLTGLSIEETAEALTISPATVKRDWALAKAFLTRELERLEAA